MHTTDLSDKLRRLFRLASAWLVVLVVMLSLTAVRASADTELDYKKTYYEITLAVGDTVTLNALPFSSQNTGNYGNDIVPYTFVTGAGYDAVSLSQEFINIDTGGRVNSNDHYNCDINMTVQGIAPGTAEIEYSFRNYHVLADVIGHRMRIPHITVHVVESGGVAVSGCGSMETDSSSYFSKQSYKVMPTAVRDHHRLLGWFTEEQGGRAVSASDNVSTMYAHWAPDFHLCLAEPAVYWSDYAGSGDTFETRQAVIPYDTRSGLHHDGFTYNILIPDYDYYIDSGLVTEEPVWQFAELTDSGTDFRLDRTGSNNWVLRTDGRRPQEPMDVKLRVTCSWGGMEKSFDLLIHYVNTALPAGTDIPATIDIPYGQEAVLACHFADNYVFDNRVWYTGDVNDDFYYFADLFSWYSDGNTLHIWQNNAEPGCYAGHLTLVDGNVAFNQPVIYRVLNPDGSLPEPEQLDDAYNLSFLLMPEDTKGYNMFPEDWGHVYLNNPQVLKQLYGSDYSCSVSYVRGARADISAHLFREEAIVLDIANLDSLADGSYTVADVTLRWGDWTETTRVTILFTRPVMPDIDFETGFTLKAGEVYTATLGLSDESWYDDYFVYYDFNDESKFEKWIDFPEGGGVSTRFCIRPLEPGWYWAAPHIHASNMRIQGETFAFAVTDENGVVPDLDMNFRVRLLGRNDEGDVIEDGGQYTIYQAVIPNEALNDVLRYDNALGFLYLDGYDVLRHTHEGNPSIQITELTNTGAEVRLERNLLRARGVRPQSAVEARYKVTCDWDDIHKSFTLIVNHENVPLPTGGLGIPDVIDMRVGQETVIEMDFSDGYVYRNQMWTTGWLGNEDWDWFDNEFDRWNEGSVLHITPHNPGLYAGRVNLVDTNISLGKDVLFRVADWSGELIEPKLCLRAYEPGVGDLAVEDGASYTVNQAIIPNERMSDVLSHNGFIGRFYVSNERVLRYYLEGDPSLQIRELTDTGAVLRFDEGNHLIYDSGTGPQSAAQARYEITCDWGGLHTGCTLTVNFQEVELPTGELGVPDIIDMRVGEETVLELDFSGGYVYQGQFWSTGYLGDGDWQWFDEQFDRYDEGATLHITPRNAGLYVGRLALVDTNISLGKDVLFVVRDQNGEIPIAQNAVFLPENLSVIEPEAFAGAHHIVVYMPSGVTEIGDGAFDASVNVIIVCDRDSYAYGRCLEMGLTVVAR